MKRSYRKLAFRDQQTFAGVKGDLMELGAEPGLWRFPIGDRYITGYSQNYVRQNLILDGKKIKLEYNSLFGITLTKVTVDEEDGLVGKIATDNGLKEI